jgi:hypothetical protein
MLIIDGFAFLYEATGVSQLEAGFISSRIKKIAAPSLKNIAGVIHSTGFGTVVRLSGKHL